MAFASLGFSYCPSPIDASSAITKQTMVIDAAGEKAAFVVMATKTGTIRKVGFRVATVTSAGDVDVRLEGVSLTTGDPDGSLLHASAELLAFTISTIGWKTADFGVGNGAPVTIGDYIAVVIRDNASSAPNIAIQIYGDQILWRSVYPVNFTSTWQAPSTSSACNVGLELSDGTYMPGMGYMAWSDVAETAFSNADTPDHVGLRFKFPYPVRVVGAWSYMDLDGNGNMLLFDSDGTTILETVSMDKDIRRATSDGIFAYWFNGTHELTKDLFYRLVIEPTSGTNITMSEFLVDSVAVMDVHEGGQDFHLTTSKTQTAEGDWTQTLTRRPIMGLILDQHDDGAGGAGGGGPLIGGRLVG